MSLHCQCVCLSLVCHQWIKLPNIIGLEVRYFSEMFWGYYLDVYTLVPNDSNYLYVCHSVSRLLAY